MVKKKRNSMKTPAPSRKDFEIFARGVERLEELQAELNSLNTSKYPEETAAIRSKLKSVSYIPEIEKELRILKTKIAGKYKAPKTGAVNLHYNRINNKIKELEREINKKRSCVGSKEISKIPKIERQIKSKKRVDTSQSLEINKLEGQIKYLKSILNKQKQEEERKKELLKKIDPGVNFLIDNKFNLSLNEVKAELSKRIRTRETELQKQLQDDLEARKKIFNYNIRIWRISSPKTMKMMLMNILRMKLRKNLMMH